MAADARAPGNAIVAASPCDRLSLRALRGDRKARDAVVSRLDDLEKQVWAAKGRVRRTLATLRTLRDRLSELEAGGNASEPLPEYQYLRRVLYGGRMDEAQRICSLRDGPPTAHPDPEAAGERWAVRVRNKRGPAAEGAVELSFDDQEELWEEEGEPPKALVRSYTLSAAEADPGIIGLEIQARMQAFARRKPLKKRCGPHPSPTPPSPTHPSNHTHPFCHIHSPAGTSGRAVPGLPRRQRPDDGLQERRVGQDAGDGGHNGRDGRGRRHRCGIDRGGGALLGARARADHLWRGACHLVAADQGPRLGQGDAAGGSGGGSPGLRRIVEPLSLHPAAGSDGRLRHRRAGALRSCAVLFAPLAIAPPAATDSEISFEAKRHTRQQALRSSPSSTCCSA